MSKSSSSSTKSSGTAGRRRVRFEVNAAPGSQVSVAGSFNGWDPKSHVLRPVGEFGLFQRYVYLPPGKYEYKFVIDGEWSADPNCKTFSTNEFGSLNSVMKVSSASPSGQRSKSAS